MPVFKRFTLRRRLATHSFAFLFPAYVMVGVAIISVGVYWLDFALGSEIPEQMRFWTFLYKVTGCEAFPLSGFVYTPFAPLCACVLTIVAVKASSLVTKVLVSLLAIVLSLLIALTYLPTTITTIAPFMAVGLVMISILIARNFDPFKAISFTCEPTKVRKQIELAHAQYLSVMQQSIWAIITAGLAGVAGVVVWVFQTGFFWHAPIFARGQVIILLIIIAYVVLGLMLGISLYCFNIASELMRRIPEMPTQPSMESAR